MKVTELVVPPGPMISTGNTMLLLPPVGGVVPDGVSVTEAEAVNVVLVAVTVTVCCEEIELGAVYNPLELMLPTTGLIDQVTLGGALPPSPLELVTAAVNCCVFDADSET